MRPGPTAVRIAAGMLLAGLALGAELALVAPLRAQNDALQAVAPAAVRAAPGPGAPEVQLARFHAAFPPLDALPAALGGLDDAARQAGVPLRSAEYRLEPRTEGSASPLARYRIALRTAGDYARIRDFLGRLLEQQPFVALDDVQLRRTGDAALEAEVRLSIYLRQR